MKKSPLALGVLALVAVLVLVGAVGYVSLLGENNKIDELTQTFFQEIRGGTYGEITSGVRVKVPGPPEMSTDSLFLLELSLLKHYDLLNNDAYEVITRRSHLWIPFVEENPVDIAVLLRKKSDGRSFKNALASIGRLWSRGDDADFVGRLLTVRRINGNWVVESVNISGGVLEKTYAIMRERLQMHQYVTKNRHGFVVHEFPVNLESMDPVERHLLLHALQEVQVWLEGPKSAASTDKIPVLRLR
jgi:hypothetical protein